MNGSGPNNEHKRRRSDRQGTGTSGVIRNLDWQTLPTDIELFDQSPLVIAQALATTDGTLRLTPAASETADAGNSKTIEQVQGSNITSIQSLQNRREHRDHNNLLTRHTASALRQRCRKLAVKHALVKNPGDQRLYLAVGMLEWFATEIPAPGRQKQPFCSPLLFYPMHLVTVENEHSESGYIHSIRNDCDLPEFNYQLASELRNQRGITLPVYKASQTLAEFFEQINECIGTRDDLKLLPRIALGLARAPAGITSKTQNSSLNSLNLPGHFDVTLAQNIISGKDMVELRSTLRLLTAANDVDLISDEESADLPSTPEINEVREYSTLLHRHGLGHTRFQELPALPEQIEQWCESIEPLTQGKMVTEVLQQDDIGAIPLLKLAGMLELLDRAPSDIDAWIHPDLAYSGTPLLFKRAKYQARLIEEELSNLKDHFHLDRVPPKHQLLQLLDELSGSEGQQIEVVDSDYFHARRRFMELSMDKPTTLTDFHKRQLNKLVKVLRFRELFVNNSEYRLALGPSYRGLRTDWDQLESNINYAQEISEYVCSEAIAAQILGNWAEFRSHYIDNLDDLQIIGRNLHRLLQLGQNRNTDLTVSHLLANMQRLAAQLKQWNNEYGLITNYGDKTPAMLLGIFTGRYSQDKKTEDNVNDTRKVIQHFLINNRGKHSVQRVQSTLEWLNTAIEDDSTTLDVIEAVLRGAEDGLHTNDQITS